jgi:hypothetical protein
MYPIHLAIAVAVGFSGAAIQGQTPSQPPVVVLAGTPASAENPCHSTICREFDLYSDDRATSVLISTVGLGDARLRAGTCSAKSSSIAKTILRIEAKADGTRICLCIPGSGFPATGTVTGKIIASSPPTTVEAAIALNGTTSPSQHFVAALLWGLGFAIPALFSTYLGQRVYLWQKRKEGERETAINRRLEIRIDPDAEQRFFVNYLPQLAGSSDEVFIEDMNGQYATIERFLTAEDAVAIKAALDAGNRAATIAILRRNFPYRGTVLDSIERKG